MIDSQTQAPTLVQNRAARVAITRIPMGILVVAVLASLLHMAPFWRAQSQLPPGWTFTGNLSISPDLMQYRMWTRQTLETGLLVSNRFTSEPNPPHLLMIFYYIIGKISAALDISPEYVYAYAGTIFAFAFVVLIYVFLRQFFQEKKQLIPVFAIILLGGGLGAHLRILANMQIVRNIYILHRTLVEGLWAWPIFEAYRGSYPFIALFDTHYLLFWLIASLAVFFLYQTLKVFSPGRFILTAILFGLSTLIHLYDGITLIAIAAGIGFLLWTKKLLTRSMVITLVVCSLVAVVALVVHGYFYAASGLPTPPWRARSILFSTLMISYPVAWALIFWGWNDFWKKASFNEIFLAGWALGCLLLTLSGPFYPYPDRGILTLQIPLYIIAGLIFFSKNLKRSWLFAALAVLLLGVTPLQMLDNWWEDTTFRPDLPVMFINSDYRAVIDVLKQTATPEDILITDMPDDFARRDVHWLAPEYPGKLYCAHFFLTVDYENKCKELVNFYKSSPEDQLVFLQEKDIRFVFVDPSGDMSQFEKIPGLKLLKATKIGSLFEFHRKFTIAVP